MPIDRQDDEVARAWGGDVVPKVLGGVAALYLLAVFSQAARAGTPALWLPPSLAYFTQMPALFPGATKHAIDYRVEGYRCRDRTWAEIDVRPWFPIDADNKENRFHRAIHFFGATRPHRQTLRALDEFVFTHYDAARVSGTLHGDSIGGVRFVRLGVAVGVPGDGAPRYERKPLADYTAEERRDLYYTPESKREERCARVGR